MTTPLTLGIRERLAAGLPLGQYVARFNAELAANAVPEWRAALDALQDLDGIGADGPVGYWGVSLGCAIGIPLAVAEPRIAAAVFGLVSHEALAEEAARVTIPVASGTSSPGTSGGTAHQRQRTNRLAPSSALTA